MNELPSRKRNRLINYDYSQDGRYFVTVCVKDNKALLGSIVGDGVPDVPRCELSELGKSVDARIQTMNDIYDDVKTEKYVIMPNHIHMIICITNKNGSSRTPTPTNTKIPRFVSTLKRYTNKDNGFSIWQRSYHDRIIRDEHEYQMIWKYIDGNPLNPKDGTHYT